MKTDMEEQVQELNDFQKAFRDRELKAGMELRAREEANIEDTEDTDTQHGRYMTFRCDGDYYGIAITYVNEIIGIQPIAELPDMPSYIKGLINLRGKIVPILDVRERFGKPAIEYNDRTCVIVINVGEDTVGLIVDTIADVVTLEDDDILAPPASKSAGGAGHYIFGIGKCGNEVKLLVDPEKLIYEQEQ